MTARIYKTICRLDYPVSFDLMDRLGHHTQVIHESTQKLPFTESASNIAIGTHSSTNQGKADGHPYRITLSPTHMDGVVEFESGVPFSDLADNSVVGLLGKVLSGLHTNLRAYERIGMRSFVLVTSPGFTFPAVREALEARVSDLKLAVSPVATASDIAIVLEATDPDNRLLRVACGPYQREESRKYFNVEPKPDEALILDIDVSIRSVEFPKFELERFVRRHQQIVEKITSNIVKRILCRFEGN